MGVEPASDPRGDEDGRMEPREEKHVAEGFEEEAEGSSAKDPGLKEADAQRSRTPCDVVRSDLADGCVQAAESERTELGCYQKVVEMSVVAFETVQGDVLDGEGNLAKGETTEVLEDQLLNLEKEEFTANDVVDCALIDQQHQLNVRGATVLKTEALFGDEEKHDVDSQDFDDGRMPDAEGLEELEPERVLSVHEKLEVSLADTGSGLGTAKAETVVSLGLSEGKRLEGIGIDFVESSITAKVLEEVPQGSSAKEYSLGGGHAQMNIVEAGATEDVAEAATVIASKGSGCECNNVVQGSDGDQDAIEDVQDARGSEIEALLGNDQKNDVEAQELHGGKVQAAEGLQRCLPGNAPCSYQKLEVHLGNIQSGLGTARAESVVDLGVAEGQRMEDAGGLQLVGSSTMAEALEEVAGSSSAKEQQLADGHVQGEGGAETTAIAASRGIGKEATEGVQESYGDQHKIEGFCIGNGVLEEAQSSKEDKPSTYNDTMGAELNDKSIQAVEGKMGFRSGGDRTELAGDQKAVKKAERIGTVAEIIPVMSVETVADDGFNGKANLAMGGTDAPMGGCGSDKAEAVVSFVEEGENIEDVAAIELVKGRNAAEVLGEVAWVSSGKEPSLSGGHAHIGIAEAGTFEGVAETASMIGSEGIGNEHTKIMEKLDCEQNDLEGVCVGRGVPEEAESSNEEKPSTASDSMGNDGLLQFVEGQTCFTSKGERHELGGDEKAESFRMVAEISHVVAVETVEDGLLEGKEKLAKGETGVAEINLGTEVMDQFPDLKEEIPENDLVGCGLIDQHRQEDAPDARHLETALFGDEQKNDVVAQDLHDGHLQAAERLQDWDPRKESNDNEKLEVNVVDTGNGLGAAKPEVVVCLGMAEDKGLVGKADGNFILDVQSNFSENKDVKLVDENLDNKEGTIVADSCVLQAERSSVLPQEKGCTDCLTGENQEIENPLAGQTFGISPYKVDSNAPTSDKPPIFEAQNVELIQQSKVDQKKPVLGSNVPIAVMHADTSDYQEVQIENNFLERKNMEYVAVRSGTSATENDHHASYYLPFLDKETFAVSDLVWGKVKSHPWWPGQIFYPSDASDMALKHQKKDNLLVAYFGDKTFAWCDETQLKPFETNFSHMEKQSTSDLFVDSVNSVLGEVSRRVELGMSCSCLPEELHANNIYENFENAGIREGVSNCHIDKSQILNYFHPDRLLEYIKTLAWLPTLGTDRLELVIAKAQLKAFYQSKGYPELPVFQIGATIGNDPEALSQESDKLGVDSINYSTAVPVDINPGKPKSRGRGRPPKKQNHILEDTLENKSFSESMEEKSAFNLADVGEIHDEITIDDELTSLSGKKRKFIDFDSSDLGKVTDERLDLLEDFDTKLPSPTFGSSFKLGECIRRVASRLTGLPPTRKFHGETNQNSVSKSENMTFDDLSADISSPTDVEKRKKKVGITKNYSSSDEMFSQLCLAARDPMKGYSFLSIIISFFTDFRNFSVSSSSEETKHGEKVGGKRGRKRKINIQTSPSEMSTDDHMQDSYWSDLISNSGPISGLKRREEVQTRWHRKKRRSSGEASISPFSDSAVQHRQVGTITSNMKQTMTTGRSIINVEEKIVGECTPTALLLSFNGSNSLPSETDLIRIFSRFGPLKEAETEVQKKTNSVKVIFKRRSDAERAFSSAGKYSIFGPSLLSYRLKSEIHPSIMQQEKVSETPNGVGSSEFPGQLSDIHPGIIQEEKDTETPHGVGSSEVPDQLSDIPPTILQEEKDSGTLNGVGSSEAPGQPSNNLSIMQHKDSETLNEVGSLEVPGQPFDIHLSIMQQEEDSETPNGVGSWEITGQPSDIHLSPMQQDEDSETPNGVGSSEVPGQPSEIHPSIMQQDDNSETPDGVGSLEIPGQPSDIHVSIMQQDEDSETHNGFGSSEVLGQPSDIHLSIMQRDKDSETPDGVGSSEFPVQPSDIHPIIMQQDEDSETPDGVGSSEVLGQSSDIHPSIMQQDKDCETPDAVGSSEVPGQPSDIHPSIIQQNEDSETPDGVGSSEVPSKPSDIHPSIRQQDKDSETPNGFGSLEVPEGTRVLSDNVQTEAAEEGSVEMVIETSGQPHN
ncbi:uncharacterized protein [Typha angustifolia]|uniref:uncharacterized protein isoform X2 n=1 Tax=Typha angustifolia TaxID=59011 RepID=UPI003C2EB45C